MSDTKIIDKIRKLLALAADQTNPHVSAEALRKAQQMMEEAGLTEEAVERASVKHASAKSPFSVSKLKTYENILVHGICKAFGVQWVWGMNRSNALDNSARVNFYGPEGRVQLAVYAYEVLIRQLQRARREYVEAYRDHDFNNVPYRPDRQRLKTLGDAFCLGFVTEIQKKVVELAVTEAEADLIRSVVDANSSGTAESKPIRINESAFHAGVDAAKDAHLHRPMGANKPVSVLGETKKLGHA